jgi:16S rRNA (adenine1518-N6/adenine1519-N6)-dimethyltransferase
MELDYVKNIFSPSFIIHVLQERTLSLKKKYSQNFLINRDIASRIIKLAGLNKDSTVLEIGPGLGTLTFLIAKQVKRIIAVEIDRGFTRYLQNEIEKLGFRNVCIINKDFLRLKKNDLHLLENPDKVISNFPYCIGIKALVKIVDEYQSVDRIIGTVQKELADRITAKPGTKNYSFVSVYLQYLSRVRVIEKNISPKNFFPSPEVTSSLIELQPVHETVPIEEGIFKKIVKASFSNRRKNIVNNLHTPEIGIDQDVLKQIVSERFKNVKIRAEALSVRDFIELSGDLIKFVS